LNIGKELTAAQKERRGYRGLKSRTEGSQGSPDREKQKKIVKFQETKRGHSEEARRSADNLLAQRRKERHDQHHYPLSYVGEGEIGRGTITKEVTVSRRKNRNQMREKERDQQRAKKKHAN